LLLEGLNASAWGNSPTDMTAITDSPNAVPSDDAMISIVMNPTMRETESIFASDLVS
jgi:hypothetical protein